MTTRHILIAFTFCLLAFAGCSKKSPASKYHIEQDGYGFGPGADKIILDLRADGTLDVKAGKLVMLDSTWTSDGRQVNFASEQGSIVMTYRIDGTALVPMKDGKDVTGWRWRRQ